MVSFNPLSIGRAECGQHYGADALHKFIGLNWRIRILNIAECLLTDRPTSSSVTFSFRLPWT